MKVTQEKLPASQMGLEIEIPSDASKQAYEKAVQEFMRSVNIPGFRKGKVPRQVLLQRVGSLRIKAAALEELIQKSVQDAIEQEKIQAIGNYQLRSSFEELITQFEPGQPITFSAAVDVQPEVTLHKYSGLIVKAEEIKPDPAQVDQVLEEQRNRQATLIPVENRPAQMGDMAIVDYKASFPDSEAAADQSDDEDKSWEQEDFQVELAEGRFVPGFVDGLIGMNPGETRELPIEFPADYMIQELSGKTALFTVTLKELKEKEPPALDDDFAQAVSEFETLAELRDSLETRYREEAERKTSSNKERALLEELLNHVEVDLPESLIDQEITYMLTQTAMQLENQGFDYKQIFTREAIPGLRERSRPEAIKRIQRSLALGEIAKRESIQADPEAVKAKVKEIVAELEDRAVDLERIQSAVEEDVLKAAIFKWLEENCTIELLPEGSLQEAAEAEAEAEAAISESIELMAEAAPISVEAEVVLEATSEAEAGEEASPSTLSDSGEDPENRSRTTSKASKSKAKSTQDE
ncbi:trigger factor [Leptolyngbya sp. 'hensonii']|uniref:trigger factor n=1 Tax=Leptolyngbya sp. 'hensonii' TaxID=1922337 RepID=UPI00094FAF94|nr:trigger factor [Leptolyngbya sp. 'hensonii']OLP18105.1 trigger factor [Leptolyngbya sp. 'hensonii']